MHDVICANTFPLNTVVPQLVAAYLLRDMVVVVVDRVNVFQ